MTVREQSEMLELSMLSQYACPSIRTRGRRVPEKRCDIRMDFQRDRDRILHCNAFRRLKHKTQVFLAPMGDHYRTRLTHTLEVAQIARTIARGLRLNEDLTEAIALGHDLGHTPFGHSGEYVLNELCPHGFRHYLQSIRVVDYIEDGGRGLNLTYEVRNGIACHTKGKAATLEGRVVKLSDKVAYINHDIEDAIRAGILQERELPFNCLHILGRSKSQRITTIIRSVIEHSTDQPDIQMADDVAQAHGILRNFMFEQVYTNPLAKTQETKAKNLVRFLYEYFLQHPDKLPELYQEIARDHSLERGVCDYIAGMSDSYAVMLFQELFVPRHWDSPAYS